MKWYYKKYDELTLDEFHELVAERIEVFVIEQDCPYQELDGKDKVAHHVYAMDDDGNVLAYARILPQGISYDEVAIGRVITTQKGRGKGLGHQLLQNSMQQVRKLFGDVPVRLSAQEHLQGYYGAHGFKTVSDMYLEDNIPHVEMLYQPNN